MVIKWVKEVVPYILIILVILLVRKYIVTPVRVNGSSMEPTLYDKEILLLEKYNKNFERFDVVVVNTENGILVKRIIAMPNEYIEYKNNELFIDGKLIKNNVLNETNDFVLEDTEYDIIPEDYYFVLGDNRENSLDSRYIGPVSKKDIMGTVRFRFYPFDKLGSID